jgi:hypothetical protein
MAAETKELVDYRRHNDGNHLREQPLHKLLEQLATLLELWVI